MKNKKDRRLRIIWNSNAPWSTSGYGNQMAEVLPPLHRDGWTMAQVCFYGLEGGKLDWQGIPMYPKIADIWGADAMVNHAIDFKADTTITSQDIWTLDPNLLSQVKNWIPYVPIDHETVPDAIYDRLKIAYRVVVPSQFAKRALAKRGMNATYIPYSVNTGIFKLGDRKAARADLHIPQDIFLFGMVGANKDNPPRKGFQEALDAFKLFHDQHPNSGMYVHTLFQQQGGFDVGAYAKHLGIEKQIYHLQPYEQMFKVDKATMARIMSSFDVLLSPSTNEGFGVPIVEAQACGIPAIVTNCTAMPELVIPGATGEICEVASKRFSPLGAYTGVASVDSLYGAMEKLYAADRTPMALAARRHVLDNYDTAKVVAQQWIPFLEKVQNELLPAA